MEEISESSHDEYGVKAKGILVLIEKNLSNQEHMYISTFWTNLMLKK